MANKKKYIIAAVIALLLGLGSWAAFSNTFTSTWNYLYKKIVFMNKNYIATVNGQKVSVGEFKLMLDSFVKPQMQENGVTDFNKMNMDGKKAIDVAKETAFTYIVNYKIAAQQAKAQGVVLNAQEQADVDKRADEDTANQKLMEELSKAGLGTQDLKNMYIESKLAYKLREKIVIPDSQVRDYYEQNKESFKVDREMVRARHILINAPSDAPQQQVDQAKKKAEGILARAKAGEDFASLAKQFSEDPGSKDNGGEYTFGKGEMVKEFEDAAFSLKPGEISGLVKTKFGFHIIKLEEKYAKDQQMTFESVRGSIEDQLKAQEFDKQIESLKKGAQIDKNEEVYNSIQ